MPFFILSAGRDAQLASKRSAALNSAGYEVVTVTTASDLINRLFSGEFDAVILCNSLPDQERRKLAGIVKSYSPSTPVIIVADTQGAQYDYGTRTASGAPAELIAAIGNAFSSGKNLRSARSA
jgi:DNA-binding NtrC family response regulator